VRLDIRLITHALRITSHVPDSLFLLEPVWEFIAVTIYT
jgi:hypothetical protein